MVKNLLFTFLTLLVCISWSYGQGSVATLEGRVIDDLGEGAAFANVALYQNGALIRGVETDFDGNYAITNVNPGTYDVEATYVGLNPQRQTGVQLLSNRIVRVNFELTKGINLDEVVVVDYKVPLIQVDETSSGGIKTAEDIKNLPIKNITGIAATTAGVTTRGDDTNIRGARAESTVFILDGIVTRGALPPQTEIEQLELITGGLEAKYGDVTGGVISLTSKGPSQKYSGYLEYETTELTDDFGYNLYNGSISGPILKNSKGKSIVGFRLGGQLLTQVDNNPSGVGVYRATEDAINSLIQNPDTIFNNSTLARAEFINPNDVQLLEARPNEDNTAIDLTGKLDFRLSDDIDMTISGTYNDREDRFVPGSAQVGGAGLWSLLNHINNPYDENTRIRANVRLRHRIGYSNATPGEGEERKDIPVIGGVTYSIQAGVERFEREIGDWQHRDNLFQYGHIGNYDIDFNPNLTQVTDSSLFAFADTIFNPTTLEDEYWMHTGFQQNLTNYTQGQFNPGLGNQNRSQEGEVLGNILEYNFYNGLRENNVTNLWSGTYNNVGSIYDRFSKTQFDQVTGNVQVSVDLYPTKKKNNRHALEFGFIYEQRTNRFWRADPTELWITARQQANAHLNFVDTSFGAIGSQELILPYGTLDVPIYRADTVGSTIAGNSLFWQRIRESLNVDLFDQVNVDELSPDQLSIDMFSASELTERDIVDYYGFDYQGNPTTGNITFDDFFTSTVDVGQGRSVRDFPVAPFQPIYWAGYIQDKFSVKDIIFKVGVRVDRYDANTKVLRDPFSLYQIQNASDFYNNNPQEGPQPANVGDDYLVYTVSDGSTEVRGFRSGEQWFNVQGEELINADQLFQGNLVTAALVDPNADIQGDDFDLTRVNQSFRDYEPQLNVAPRIAVSFPISDEANFFAHYDVLVQRPGFQQTDATPLNYYFFNRNAGFIENPNLRPQKTIDYEVGFKQKISNTSAITLAAYYREQRDMIQLRRFRNLPQSQNNSVPEYLSYDNIDFGTTYGFTAQLDMRRTGNFQMNLNYTLAFADGTGSGVNSSFGFNDNLRVLSPLTFDERHQINVIADYRYATGNAYNGPKIGDFEVFGNTGLNVQTNLISGRPYTRAQIPTQLPNRDGGGFLGSINGARLPWVFSVDARLDRNINLTKKGAKTPLSLNVYVRVTNIFDRENVIDNYNATGSATDDGFLNINEGERLVNNLDAAQRIQFLNAYNWATLSPGFFTAPRRIFLGAIFQF